MIQVRAVDGDVEVRIFWNVAVVEDEEYDEADGGRFAAFGNDSYVQGFVPGALLLEER